MLLEDLFGVDREEILLASTQSVDKDKLDLSIEKLLNHEPIQYVTGVAHFYGRTFRIQRGALIPRPETEELVDLIVRENRVSVPKILDVGVGSGCIAISLALALQGDVSGTDVSTDALIIASGNAANLGANVEFIRHDILNEPLAVGNLDVLVSNPPYIPESDRKDMAANVLQFEPSTALFVPNDDPLVFYKSIAKAGRHSLKSTGKLYFEIHEQFGHEVKQLLEELGYTGVRIHKDMQGKERMVSAINSTSR